MIPIPASAFRDTMSTPTQSRRSSYQRQYLAFHTPCSSSAATNTTESRKPSGVSSTHIPTSIKCTSRGVQQRSTFSRRFLESHSLTKLSAESEHLPLVQPQGMGSQSDFKWSEEEIKEMVRRREGERGSWRRRFGEFF